MGIDDINIIGFNDFNEENYLSFWNVLKSAKDRILNNLSENNEREIANKFLADLEIIYIENRNKNWLTSIIILNYFFNLFFWNNYYLKKDFFVKNY